MVADANIFVMANAFDLSSQDDIDTFALWSKKWQLPFNVMKCKSLHIEKNNLRTNYSYTIDDGHISENEKDLGVYDHDIQNYDRTCKA